MASAKAAELHVGLLYLPWECIALGYKSCPEVVVFTGGYRFLYKLLPSPLWKYLYDSSFLRQCCQISKVNPCHSKASADSFDFISKF